MPGIWRALQCLRRYRDMKDRHHLFNCGKYICTILYYMTLSLYRIDKTAQLRDVFIVFATINSIYCSTWDLLVDWSVMDMYAEHRYLRNTLAYKRTWPYYLAIVLDPILRFNWIFYAIYTHSVQHSTIAAFLVGLSEVLRRGMWVIFRVENEHCTNVGKFKASRDAPLPYELHTPSPQQQSTVETSETSRSKQNGQAPQRSGWSDPMSTARDDLERGSPAPLSAAASLRQRKGQMATQSPMVRAMTLLHSAHAKDFERKRKPDLTSRLQKDNEGDDDDDDDDEGESESEPESALARRSTHGQGNRVRLGRRDDAHGKSRPGGAPANALEITRETIEDERERSEMSDAEAALETAGEGRS